MWQAKSYRLLLRRVGEGFRPYYPYIVVTTMAEKSNWAQAMEELYARSPSVTARYHCKYCHFEGVLRMPERPEATTLCPECDMPVETKLVDNPPPMNLTQIRAVVSGEVNFPPGMEKCGYKHVSRALTVCQLPKAHKGFHVDTRGAKGYAWRGEGAHRSPDMGLDIPLLKRKCGAVHPAVCDVACELDKHDGGSHEGGGFKWFKSRDTAATCGDRLFPDCVCKLPLGHEGMHGNGSGTTWSQKITSRRSEPGRAAQQPVVKEPVERAGKPMITAKLNGGRLVAVVFNHEIDVKGGGVEKVTKTLKATEARLFELMEQSDPDKPGVTMLVRRLMNTAYVRCHPNDRHLGKAGGRRAALTRLLCDHVIGRDKRCEKCFIAKDAVSTAAEYLVKDERGAVWQAYWQATASVKTHKCGCASVTTVPGEFEFRTCEQHKPKEAQTSASAAA